MRWINISGKLVSNPNHLSRMISDGKLVVIKYFPKIRLGAVLEIVGHRRLADLLDLRGLPFRDIPNSSDQSVLLYFQIYEFSVKRKSYSYSIHNQLCSRQLIFKLFQTILLQKCISYANYILMSNRKTVICSIKSCNCNKIITSTLYLPLTGIFI